MPNAAESQGLHALLDAVNAVDLRAPGPSPSTSDELTAEELDAALLPAAPGPRTAEQRLNATLRHDTIKACPGCGQALGLPAPRVGFATETWRCKGCATVVLTGPTQDIRSSVTTADPALRETVVPVGRLASSEPSGREKLIQRLVNVEKVGPEHRQHPRYSISLPAIGVPLDETRHACRPAVRVTTRDISLSGLSLFAEKPIAASLLLVDFTPAGLHGCQAVIEINRREVAGFLHEVGGQFVAT